MKKEEMSLKTKLRLADALKQETARKPFDKITVSTLLQSCDRKKQTGRISDIK